MRSLSAVLGFDVLDTLFEKWDHLSRLTTSKELLEVLGDQGFIDHEEGSSCWPREDEHERPWWPAACVGLVSSRTGLLPSGVRFLLPPTKSPGDYMVVRWKYAVARNKRKGDTWSCADKKRDSLESRKGDRDHATLGIGTTIFDDLREIYVATAFFQKMVLPAYEAKATSPINSQVRRLLRGQWDKFVDQRTALPTSGEFAPVAVVGRGVLDDIRLAFDKPEGRAAAGRVCAAYGEAEGRGTGRLSAHSRRRLGRQGLQFVRGPGVGRGRDRRAKVEAASRFRHTARAQRPCT